jgi:hypothetical protein
MIEKYKLWLKRHGIEGNVVVATVWPIAVLAYLIGLILSFFS